MAKNKLEDIFEDFKDSLTIEDNEHSFSIKFKNNPFIRISKKTLTNICVELLPAKAVRQIFELEQAKEEIKEVKKHLKNANVHADSLLKVYYAEKDKFFKGRVLRKIKSTSKEYKFFIQALEIMELHKATAKEFILAQIDGLAFLEGTGGGFPSPSQIATQQAEDRLLRYRFKQNQDQTKHKKMFKAQPLTVYDKETPLMENKKFTEFLEKVRDKSANKSQAIFVKDLMEFKRGAGKALPEVYEFISQLEGTK